MKRYCKTGPGGANNKKKKTEDLNRWTGAGRPNPYDGNFFEGSVRRQMKGLVFLGGKMKAWLVSGGSGSRKKQPKLPSSPSPAQSDHKRTRTSPSRRRNPSLAAPEASRPSPCGGSGRRGESAATPPPSHPASPHLNPAAPPLF